MIPCAFCDRPLVCRDCGAEYHPPSFEHYEALSRPETPIDCPECEAPLVCRWCQTPYGVPGDLGENEDS